MDEKKNAKALAMRAAPTLSIDEICKTLGISRATFYRSTGTQA